MQEAQPKNNGILHAFTTHGVAANLLMACMLLLGVWGLNKLNFQLFPNFEFDWIVIDVAWSGASAEDVERSITIPMEQELKTLSGLVNLFSRSEPGRSSFYMEISEHEDIGQVLDDVKQRVAVIRNLPQDAEEPVVRKLDRYSQVAHILVTGASRDEMRPLIHEMKDELLSRGIGRVDITGLPQEEIAIQISSQTLHDFGLSLTQFGNLVKSQSQDFPAGTAGRKEATKQVRSLAQARDVTSFEDLPLWLSQTGQLVSLGNIASIERRAKDNQAFITNKGKPAIELTVLRTESDDTLESARVMEEWLAEKRQELPPNIKLTLFFEQWKHLEDRINTLLKNGISGLILVIATLYLFLNARIATWVTIGIPVSFMATLGVLYFLGGSLNMMSLFALILALGIIVDDAIVVGEDTLTHRQMGEPALQAALGGAQRMFPPVLASSLTTIAAFFPIMMVTGVMGKFMFELPLVVICVILASLVECFLILPGHLHHSLKKEMPSTSKLREAVDTRFAHFQQNIFRPVAKWSVKNPGTTLILAICTFIIALALPATGHLEFNLFPAIDQPQIRASVQFSAGTPAETTDRFLNHLEKTLYETNEEFGGDLINIALQQHREFSTFASIGGQIAKIGDEYGMLSAEIRVDSERETTNEEFMTAWRDKIQVPAGVEQLIISQRESGPPGKPIEVQLYGTDIHNLKAASAELQDKLKTYSGLSNVSDDIPYGKEQLIYKLTPAAEAEGFTTNSIGQQLRAALDGQLVQLFNDRWEEVEVRAILPDKERNHLNTLDHLPIISPSGEAVPLGNLVTFEAFQGVEMLRRSNGRLTVVVSSNVDTAQQTPNEVIRDLESSFFPEFKQKYGIDLEYGGKLESQAKSFADMRMGTIVGLVMIYLVLAMVFSSYSWPFAVMAAIFLGVTGAIIGHFLVSSFGIQYSLLSLMGLFGLSGIIVNDSIVLVSFYRRLRESGMIVEKAIVEACVLRLRAVLLTSITTIAGLTPILFEGSLQAQFLKPMAASIVFGLAFGTMLILLVVPACIILLENLKHKVRHVTEEAMQIGQNSGD